MKTVLQNRSLVILGLSETVSGIGTWVTMMAVLNLFIFRGQGGVTQSGLILMAGLIPTLIFSPIAGWLCDHFDRKRLMIASELLSALAVSGIFFIQSQEIIYLLIALQATAGSVMGPARQSSMPSVIHPENLTQANAFLQQLSSFIKIFGPVLGGFVLSIFPAQQAVILDVISYIISTFLLCFLPPLKPKKQSFPIEHLEKEKNFLSPVITLLKTSSQLRILYLMAFVAVQGIIAIDILSPIFTRDVLKGGENYYGLVMGLIGFGTLMGGLSLFIQKSQDHLWRDILSGLSLLALIPASMAISYYLPDLISIRIIVFIACFIGGFGLGRKSVQAGTLLQTIPPAHLLGRASGIFYSVVVEAQIIGVVLTPIAVPTFFSIFFYCTLVSGMILLAVIIAIFALMKVNWQEVHPALTNPQE